MGAMFGQPVLFFVYFFKKMYDYDDLPKGNNHHYACQGARALVCLRNRHCSSCSFLERKKVILPTLGTPSAARLLSSQQSNAFGRVTNGSQSERRAIRFPPGGILSGRTWGSLCLMGSANPISATNALTELRADSGPVLK